MSKFIKPNIYTDHKYVYLADPKSKVATRVKFFDLPQLYSLQDRGFAVTTKDIYERYIRFGNLSESFNPVEYPTNSGKFVHANIFYKF